MKKLNNKGFAISTLLYGLILVAFLVVSLLMSIMATNRKNTSTLIKKIEEELNRYSQTITEFTSTDGAQEFIVPYGKSGWYKIELWGAGAKNADPTKPSTYGTKGGYTSGVIYLEENTHLYFQIGSKGGSGGTPNNTTSSYAGGATDVRLVGGNWNNSDGLKSKIMVAGGGGYSDSDKGTGGGGPNRDLGYYNTYNGRTYIAGYGIAPVGEEFGFINTHLMHGVHSGAGKATIELVSTNSKDNPPAKKTNILDNVRYIKDCITSTKSSVSKERWTEIQAFDSNGKNVALNTTAKIGTYTVGRIVDGNKTPISTTSTYSSGSGEKCVVVDLGTTYNLEEIVIFHQGDDTDDRTYTTEKISVSQTGSNSDYKIIKSWTSRDMAPAESAHGIRCSARDLEGDPSIKIPAGNYFIHNVMSLAGVVTAQGDAAVMNMNTGQKGQRWAITPTEEDWYYSIVEVANSRALQPINVNLESEDVVGITSGYNKHAWEEWKFVGLNNGYYQIKSKANENLCLGITNNLSGTLKIYTCITAEKKQWFRLVNADF